VGRTAAELCALIEGPPIMKWENMDSDSDVEIEQSD
jgi:hypothetical protein